MATFGEMINLQPYILNWLVNGDNSDLAFRQVTSEKVTGNGFKKVTYEGDYQDLIDKYLLPTSREKSTNYALANGSSTSLTYGSVSYPTTPGASYTVTYEVAFSMSREQVQSMIAADDTGYFFYGTVGRGYGLDLDTFVDNGDTFDASIYAPYFSDAAGIEISHNYTYNYDEEYIIKVVITSQVGAEFYVNGQLEHSIVSANDITGAITPNDVDVLQAGSAGYLAANVRYIKISTTDPITTQIHMTVDDLINGTNSGELADPTVSQAPALVKVGGLELYPDRFPAYPNLHKGKLLKSLVEYKRRWNINGDSATLKIDYIGFKGDKLVVKTTESSQAPVVFGVFNGTTSQVTYPNSVSYLQGGLNTVIYELDFRADEGGAAGDYAVLLSGEDSENLGDYTHIALTVNPGSGIVIGYIQTKEGSPISVIFQQNAISYDTEWHTARVEVTENSGNPISIVVYVDGNQVATSPIINAATPTDAYSLYNGNIYATTSGGAGNLFEGSLKNLKLTLNGTVVLDCIDPSTGINSGTGDNGVVVDVVQGTV